MAVPGRPVPEGAPADLVQTELFAVDAYLRDFEARVESVDTEGHRVRLARTAFYPGGGGQPHDLGSLTWSDGRASVSRVARDRDDGGTHVLSTAEVGIVSVTGTESKGKGNKRVRLEVRD